MCQKTLREANALDQLTCAHVVVVDVAALQVSVNTHPVEQAKVRIVGVAVVITFDLPHQPEVIF